MSLLSKICFVHRRSSRVRCSRVNSWQAWEGRRSLMFCKFVDNKPNVCCADEFFEIVNIIGVRKA